MIKKIIYSLVKEDVKSFIDKNIKVVCSELKREINKIKEEIKQDVFKLIKLNNYSDIDLKLCYKHKTFGEIKEFERDFLCDRFNLFYSKPHFGPIKITCPVKTSVYPSSYICETIESFLLNKKLIETLKKEQAKEYNKKNKSKTVKTTKKPKKEQNQ